MNVATNETIGMISLLEKLNKKSSDSICIINIIGHYENSEEFVIENKQVTIST